MEADAVRLPDHVLGVPERGLVSSRQADRAVEGPEVEAELREALVELDRRIGAKVEELLEDGSLVKGLFGFLKAEGIDPLKASEQSLRLIQTLRRIGGLEAGGESQVNVFALMAEGPGAITDSE